MDLQEEDKERLLSDTALSQNSLKTLADYNSLEDSTESTKDVPKVGGAWDIKNVVLGHIFLFFMQLCFYGSSLAAQMSLTGDNIFTMNSIRFAAQAIVSGVIGILLKHSFRIKSGYWTYAIGAAVVHVFYGILLFYAVMFMPIGNADALFSAFYIFFSTSYDICRQVVDKVSVITIAIALIGIILLIQPWALSMDGGSAIVPCGMIGNAKANYSIITNNNTRSTIEMNSVDGTRFLNQIIGYTLIVLSGLCAAIYSNFTKTFVTEHPFTIANVLLGIIGALASLGINGVQKGLSHKPFFSFSEGTICALFLLLFVVSTVAGNLLEACTLKYIPVSEMALSGSVLTVLFYISQRTFLYTFHPGHANVIEIVAIVIIVLSNIANTVNRFRVADS